MAKLAQTASGSVKDEAIGCYFFQKKKELQPSRQFFFVGEADLFVSIMEKIASVIRKSEMTTPKMSIGYRIRDRTDFRPDKFSFIAIF